MKSPGSISSRITRAINLTRFGARWRDRVRILALTIAMPLVRATGGIRPLRLLIRVDGHVVRWTANNYADLGVLEEVFGAEIYQFSDSTPPATIVDIGSHVGASVLYFALRYPATQIIAIEADPYNFDKLRRNVGHLVNVKLIHGAAASEPGSMTLYASGRTDSWKSSTTPLTRWQQPVTVPAVRLDDLLSQYTIATPLVVKIDIEGAEYDVLSSFKGLGGVTEIVGEVHPMLFRPSLQEFTALFDDFVVEMGNGNGNMPFRARRVADRDLGRVEQPR
jgi:FkbM family methyltransferase